MENIYAIVKTGGKQYSVRPGELFRVEKLEANVGDTLDLKEVLLVGGDVQHIGKPMLAGSSVKVVVTQQDKAPKVIIFKKKRRQGYRRFKTHRQPYTELYVTQISAEGQVFKTADAVPQR